MHHRNGQEGQYREYDNDEPLNWRDGCFAKQDPIPSRFEGLFDCHKGALLGDLLARLGGNEGQDQYQSVRKSRG